MMLDHAEIAKRIENMVEVTHQQVVLAKRYFMERYNTGQNVAGGVSYSTQQMISELLRSEGLTQPTEIIIQDEDGVLSEITENMMKSTAQSISWTIAGCEAIWGLFSANLLFPCRESPRLVCLVPNLRYSQRGQSGPLLLKKSSIRVWEEIQFSRTNTYENQVLSDSDLFLQTLDIRNLHQEVEDALRESVRCFRHELYLASLTMLGRATEGAWIEMGLKIAKVIQSGSTLEGLLRDPQKGIGKKMEEIRKNYNGVDKTLREQIDVSIQDLNTVAVWSDTVRDSRNSIHYGAVSSMPNTYEKIAALLIGAVPNLRLLYKIFNGIS